MAETQWKLTTVCRTVMSALEMLRQGTAMSSRPICLHSEYQARPGSQSHTSSPYLTYLRDMTKEAGLGPFIPKEAGKLKGVRTLGAPQTVQT